MEFFKSIIRIPDLPDVSHVCECLFIPQSTWIRFKLPPFALCIVTLQEPPNFLRAAAFGEYKKPVVVVPNDENQEEEEVELQQEFRETPQMVQVKMPE